MSIPIGSYNGYGTDEQTFGAMTINKTLDYMNNYNGNSTAAPFDKETFGAAVVSKTLDYANAGSSISDRMGQSYDFQKSVLSSAYQPVGTLTDTIG